MIKIIFDYLTKYLMDKSFSYIINFAKKALKLICKKRQVVIACFLIILSLIIAITSQFYINNYYNKWFWGFLLFSFLPIDLLIYVFILQLKKLNKSYRIYKTDIYFVSELCTSSNFLILNLLLLTPVYISIFGNDIISYIPLLIIYYIFRKQIFNWGKIFANYLLTFFTS